MTTFTIYGDAADGYIRSQNASYATARAGGTLTANTTSTITIGQEDNSPVYNCYEGFLAFDTSVIGAGATVSAVTLSPFVSADFSSTDFTVNAYSRDWGSALATGDYVAGASLSGLTFVASLLTSSISTLGRIDFTSDAAFLSEINLTGFTRLLLSSSRHSGNNTPTGNEYIAIRGGDTGATSNMPKLVVVATLPISASASITEANDTPTATGTVAIAGTAPVTEADDTVGAVIYTESPGQIQVKHAGAWQAPTTWVKHGGTWKQPIAGYVKDAGSWKRVL